MLKVNPVIEDMARQGARTLLTNLGTYIPNKCFIDKRSHWFLLFMLGERQLKCYWSYNYTIYITVEDLITVDRPWGDEENLVITYGHYHRDAMIWLGFGYITFIANNIRMHAEVGVGVDGMYINNRGPYALSRESAIRKIVSNVAFDGTTNIYTAMDEVVREFTKHKINEFMMLVSRLM